MGAIRDQIKYATRKKRRSWNRAGNCPCKPQDSRLSSSRKRASIPLKFFLCLLTVVGLPSVRIICLALGQYFIVFSSETDHKHLVAQVPPARHTALLQPPSHSHIVHPCHKLAFALPSIDRAAPWQHSWLSLLARRFWERDLRTSSARR
jgi:hypothetical protein